MILSNQNTQQIVEIDKISKCIIYTTYENAHFRSIGQGTSCKCLWTLDKNLYPDQTLTYEENETKLAYLHLLDQPEFSDYILTIDDQAWTDPARDIRIFINNKRVMQSIEADDDCVDIVTRLRDENAGLPDANKFIFVGENQTVLYFSEILEDDRPIFLSMLDVDLFQENKNI